MTGTIHEQVLIQHEGRSAEVDREIAPLILEIWRAGWHTCMSCQQHITGKAWVAFVCAQDAESFLNAVAIHDKKKDSRWWRMNDWYFGEWGTHSGPIGLGTSGTKGDWEYHLSITDDAHDDESGRWRSRGAPNFRLFVSILFPRSDLANITERLHAFNRASEPAELLEREPK